MPNRRLTPAELEDVRLLLAMVRAGLRQLAGDNAELLFALRRKVYKELSYDERDKPMVRRKLKALKRAEQAGQCLACSQPLPDKYCVLDRFTAAAGYTAENTRLICQACDIAIQKSRGYA